MSRHASKGKHGGGEYSMLSKPEDYSEVEDIDDFSDAPHSPPPPAGLEQSAAGTQTQSCELDGDLTQSVAPESGLSQSSTQGTQPPSQSWRSSLPTGRPRAQHKPRIELDDIDLIEPEIDDSVEPLRRRTVSFSTSRGLSGVVKQEPCAAAPGDAQFHAVKLEAPDLKVKAEPGQPGLDDAESSYPPPTATDFEMSESQKHKCTWEVEEEEEYIAVMSDDDDPNFMKTYVCGWM